MTKKHIITELSKADYITMLAVFLIINSFWLLWQGQLYLAIALTFISMYLDFLDGYIARRFGASIYGKVLDTLYDVLGWVLFPALVINIQANWQWYSLLITTTFCLASILRLSRFTVVGYVEKKSKYYTGLPVLFSKYALLLCLLFESKISLLILVIMIPLMVSSKLIKKPHPLFAQLEIVYAIIFLVINTKHA